MQPILQAVADYVADNKFGQVIVDTAVLPDSCPLAVQTEGAIAYFRTTAHDTLMADWRTTQSEIARLPAERAPVVSLYLTLVVTDAVTLQPSWQDVVRDLHVCRKLVVATGEQQVVDWLDELPFMPIPDEYVRPRGVRTPAHTLYEAGFEPSLAEALLGRVSMQTIGERFLGGRYQRTDRTREPGAVALEGRASGRRLLKVEVDNFRPFGSPLSLPMDADLTVVYGPNGSGKSSLAQALEWGIIGEVDYLEAQNDDVRSVRARSPYVNVHHPDVPATVRLEFEDIGTGDKHTLIRTVPPRGRMHVQWGRGDTGSDDVEWLLRRPGKAEVLRTSLGARLPASIGYPTMKAMARGAHFLDQSTIRGFLSTSAGERYSALASMAGTVDFERAMSKLGTTGAYLQNRLASVKARAAIEESAYESEVKLVREARDHVARMAAKMPSEGLDKLAAELFTLANHIQLPFPHNAAIDSEHLRNLSAGLQGAIQSRKQHLDNRVVLLEQLSVQCVQVDAEQASAAAAREALGPVIRHLTELRERAEHARQQENESTLHVQRARAHYTDLELQAKKATDQLERALRLMDADVAFQASQNAEAAARDALRNAEAEYQAALDEMRLSERRTNALETHQRQFLRRRAVFSQLQSGWSRILQAFRDDKQLNAELGAQREHLALMRSQYQPAVEGLENARSSAARSATALQRLTAREDQRQSLMSSIMAFLDGARCPLCGHDWQAAEELYEQVKQTLVQKPEELVMLQRQAVGDAQAMERAQAAVREIDGRINTARRVVDELVHRQQEAGQLIDEWLRLAGTFGAVPALSDPAVPAWLETVDELLAADDRAGDLQEAERSLSETRQKAESLEVKLAQVRQHLDVLSKEQKEAQARFTRADATAPAGVPRGTGSQPDLSSFVQGVQSLAVELNNVKELLEDGTGQLLARQQLVQHVVTEFDAARAEERRLLLMIEDAKARMAAFKSRCDSAGVTPREPAIGAARGVVDEERKSLQRIEELAGLISGAVGLQEERAALRRAEEKLKRVGEVRDAVREELASLNLAAAKVDEATHALDQGRVTEQQQRLAAYEPTINELYRRINPHPYFSQISMTPRVESSELTLHARAKGAEAQLPIQRYFSMAQSNVVALSIFLGTALLQTWSGLRLICIDDPIQQMDDLNTAAFMDVLHAVIRRGHQVMITTANKDFYRLMLRRYAYLNVDRAERFRAFRFGSVNVVAGPDLTVDTPVVVSNREVRLGNTAERH